MKIWKTVAVIFSAVAVFAADSDYKSMSKYVPTANDGLAYISSEKFSGSVFVEELKKFCGDVATMPDDDGTLLVSLNSTAPNTSVAVLVVINGVSTLDELLAKCSENEQIKVEKIKVGDRDALQFENTEMCLFAVEDGVFVMLPDGQADAFFAAPKGVNAELSDRLAALEDKPLFGSFLIASTPEEMMSVSRCDVFGELAADGKTLSIEAMLFLPDEKAAAQTVQEVQSAIMMFTMAAAQKDPELGSMMMTAIKLAADKNIMTVDLNISSELIAKFKEMNTALEMAGDDGADDAETTAESKAVSVK